MAAPLGGSPHRRGGQSSAKAPGLAELSKQLRRSSARWLCWFLVAASSCATVAQGVDVHQRVVARPARQSAGAGSRPAAHGDQGLGRAAAHSHQRADETCFTRVDARHLAQQPLVVGRIAPAPPASTVAGPGAHAGAPPSAVTLIPESSANAASHRLGCMPRLGQRVLDEAVVRLIGLGDAQVPLFTSSMPSGANRVCSSASFLALLEAHETSVTWRSGAPQFAAPTAPGCPWQARGRAAPLRHLVAAEGRALGGALHFDEAAGPVITTFMSGVAGRVFGVLKGPATVCALDDANRNGGDRSRLATH